MADLNRVFLIGRLTGDPELKKTNSGSAVAELRLATGRSWVTKDGDKKDETLFIDVTVWERAAENCCKYLRKGSQIHVEGSLKMDEWADKNTGEKRSKIKVTGERVQFLDRKSDAGAEHEEGNPAGHAIPAGRRPVDTAGRHVTPPPSRRAPARDFEDESEIPF